MRNSTTHNSLERCNPGHAITQPPHLQRWLSSVGRSCSLKRAADRSLRHVRWVAVSVCRNRGWDGDFRERSGRHVRRRQAVRRQGGCGRPPARIRPAASPPAERSHQPMLSLCNTLLRRGLPCQHEQGVSVCVGHMGIVGAREGLNCSCCDQAQRSLCCKSGRWDCSCGRPGLARFVCHCFCSLMSLANSLNDDGVPVSQCFLLISAVGLCPPFARRSRPICTSQFHSGARSAAGLCS